MSPSFERVQVVALGSGSSPLPAPLQEISVPPGDEDETYHLQLSLVCPGSGALTVTDFSMLPAGFVQVRVYIFTPIKLPVKKEPLKFLRPGQVFEPRVALHSVALVEIQFIVIPVLYGITISVRLPLPAVKIKVGC